MKTFAKKPQNIHVLVSATTILVSGCQCPCHQQTSPVPTCAQPKKKSGGHLATDPKFAAGYEAIFAPKPRRKTRLPQPSVN